MPSGEHFHNIRWQNDLYLLTDIKSYQTIWWETMFYSQSFVYKLNTMEMFTKWPIILVSHDK